MPVPGPPGVVCSQVHGHVLFAALFNGEPLRRRQSEHPSRFFAVSRGLTCQIEFACDEVDDGERLRSER